MKRQSFALLTGFIVVLTGCGSFPRQDFSKSANTYIRKIALIRTREPHQIGVLKVDGTGNSFGLIGAAIEAGIEANRTTEFTEKMASQNFTGGEHLTRVIKAELEGQGYEVTLIDLQPTLVNASKFQYDYSRLTTEADAILHAWFRGVAYVSSARFADWAPRVNVCARLLTAQDKTQLYFQSLMYGVDYDIKNVETLPSLGGYTYGDYDTLLAKSAEAAEGLEQGNLQIARRIGSDLGGNHRPAPRTFVGFSLGKDIATAEASCSAAGLAWEKQDGGRFSCSRTPVDLGVPMTVQVTECKGSVLEVAVDASSDGAEWRTLMQRFVKLSKLLTQTHGIPHQRDTAQLDDCIDEISTCFSRGRARTSSLWTWPEGQSFRLALEGGPAGGKPALTLTGDIRKSPQTPAECR